MVDITTIDDLEETPHAEVFERREPRTVRLQLAAEQRIPRHQHPGTSIVLHLLEGQLELTLDDEEYSLSAGDLARFSGDREISPYAIEESSAVLIFAPTGEDA
ncbi:cupin domain-containing protein [Halococcus saccharolyticus]|uniref:Cupin 2 conserved barrel domain protein n=1 Tax=Halococcus saccharolyticus DSM 5350 TaxID=1227455 RepID=M0MNI7_9EURY|nr:cupin domain-containing protein [Halococcus saccharolyticus]EMA46309.1 Cupin 2 conserved barrel domain protein [Halococcus saccharolyticus DSM 5350]